MLASDKHPSVLQIFVNNGRKRKNGRKKFDKNHTNDFHKLGRT